MKYLHSPTIVALAAAAVSISVAPLLPNYQAKATPNYVGEQYTVLELSTYSNVRQLEADLNKLGSNGWKVRTSAAGFIILAR